MAMQISQRIQNWIQFHIYIYTVLFSRVSALVIIDLLEKVTSLVLGQSIIVPVPVKEK